MSQHAAAGADHAARTSGAIMADDVPAGSESEDEYRDVYDCFGRCKTNLLVTDPDDIDVGGRR